MATTMGAWQQPRPEQGERKPLLLLPSLDGSSPSTHMEEQLLMVMLPFFRVAWALQPTRMNSLCPSE